MGHRIQFVLTDEQYEVFQQEVKASGMSISQYVVSKVLPQKTDFEEIWEEFSEKLRARTSGVERKIVGV